MDVNVMSLIVVMVTLQAILFYWNAEAKRRSTIEAMKTEIQLLTLKANLDGKDRQESVESEA